MESLTDEEVAEITGFALGPFAFAFTAHASLFASYWLMRLEIHALLNARWFARPLPTPNPP